MTKFAHPLVCITTALGLLGCPADDGDDTGADTGTISTSVSTTMTTTQTTDPTDTDADPTDDPTEDPTTTDPTVDPTAETGDECTAADECMDDSMCGGGMCLGCICIGGDETGTGECPAGETCQMTGGGGMACLGESTHCVLACGGAMACPDSMTCQGGACQYDAAMLPAMGDPNYPAPAANMCPAGFLAVSFAMNYVVCIPECDGMGPMAACPQGGSGSAVGACLTNPMSSGMMCMG